MKKLLLPFLSSFVFLTSVFAQSIPESHISKDNVQPRSKDFSVPKSSSLSTLESETKKSWFYLELSNDPLVLGLSIWAAGGGFPIPPVIPTRAGIGYRMFDHGWYGLDVSASYYLLHGFDLIGNATWNKHRESEFLTQSFSVEASILPVLYSSPRGLHFFPFETNPYLIYLGLGGGIGVAQGVSLDFDSKKWLVHPIVYIKPGIQFSPYAKGKRKHHFDIKIGSPLIVGLEYGMGF